HRAGAAVMRQAAARAARAIPSIGALDEADEDGLLVTGRKPNSCGEAVGSLLSERCQKIDPHAKKADEPCGTAAGHAGHARASCAALWPAARPCDRDAYPTHV